MRGGCIRRLAYATPMEVENATLIGHFLFVLKENSIKKMTLSAF